LTKLIGRLRALTLTLLPVEVNEESINDPTSRIITPQVIQAYKAAAGDFIEALPYCLLRARAEFMWDAYCDAADYEENHNRAIACEVLARRIVHLSPPDRINSIMSTRYRHRQLDGDTSETASALEMAIDSHCTIFLSSSEAQDVVLDLWKGELIQKNNAHHDIDYVSYKETRDCGFWDHLDPARIGVPRYQSLFRIVVWIFFLVVYSQAVREPLERLSRDQNSLDAWEIVLYAMALSFTIEDSVRLYKILRIASYRAINFWTGVSVITDGILFAAFVLRLMDLNAADNIYRVKSFQVLSFVSPFIWMKLITVFDGYKYIGMMTICVARMLQESGIFFALLSVLALGFGQGLYALDAADGEVESPLVVINVLIQALLASPNYERYAGSMAGMLLYYLWNVCSVVILLNVLISLFSSAYSDIVDDAEAEYLAFFAGKTVGMIRAPDSYVYPAPFNLIELVFIAPFEKCLSENIYNKLNRSVMSFIFFPTLAIIALYESALQRPKNKWVNNWFIGRDQTDGGSEDPQHQDPEVEGDDATNGLAISRVPFAELIKVFPNTHQSSEATVLKEISDLREVVELLLKKVNELSAK
jgi:hypothetical protein